MERAHPGERLAPFLESNATDTLAVAKRWSKANRVPLEYEATSVLTNHGLPSAVDRVDLVRHCRRRVVTENTGLPALIMDVLRLNRHVGL
jgi:hypothetical protein